MMLIVARLHVTKNSQQAQELQRSEVQGGICYGLWGCNDTLSVRAGNC